MSALLLAAHLADAEHLTIPPVTPVASSKGKVLHMNFRSWT